MLRGRQCHPVPVRSVRGPLPIGMETPRTHGVWPLQPLAGAWRLLGPRGRGLPELQTKTMWGHVCGQRPYVCLSVDKDPMGPRLWADP